MFPTDWRCAVCTALLCLFLSLMTCGHVQAQPSLDEGPQDATVRQGDNVTFVCDLRNANGYEIYWSLKQGRTNMFLSRGREIGVVKLLSPGRKSRLSIIGDESREEFTLRIEGVQEVDMGTYECLYTTVEGGTDIITAGRAQLTVLVPPSSQSPLCSVGSVSRLDGPFAVGDSVQFYCNTYGGIPAPEITYYKKNERLTPVGLSITQAYNLKAEDNGVTFTCTMTTPALDEPRNCSVMPLRILPNANIEPAVSRVEEGSLVSFECFGEGVPSIAYYKWEVTNTDAGEILPSGRFKHDDRTLEIEVRDNLELVCVVSVPSGLSGNATAIVEVVERKETTARVVLSTKSGPAGTATPPLSPVTPIAAVVAIPALVLIAAAFIVLFLWRRKQHRKGVGAGKGLNMTQTGPEYDEIEAREEEQNTAQENQVHVYAYAAVDQERKNRAVDDEYDDVSLDDMNKITRHAQDGPIVSEYLEMRDSSGYEVPSKSAHVYATVND